MFSRAELEVIADLCKKHDVLCVSDEVYEWLIYSGEHIRIGEQLHCVALIMLSHTHSHDYSYFTRYVGENSYNWKCWKDI